MEANVDPMNNPGAAEPPPAPAGWAYAGPPNPPPGYVPPPPNPPAPSRRSPIKWIALAVVAALFVLSAEAAVVGAAWTWAHSGGHNTPTASHGSVATVPQTTSPSTSSGQTIDAQAVAAKVEPAVVDINTTLKSLNQSNAGTAAGTGMILTSNGEILTNNHVIQGATSITITIPGHSGTYTASVIGVSTTADVALLQAHGVSNLPTVTLADSSTLTVGEQVVAIGNALGQGVASVTQGSITALDQSITANDGSSTEQLSGLIQSARKS